MEPETNTSHIYFPWAQGTKYLRHHFARPAAQEVLIGWPWSAGYSGQRVGPFRESCSPAKWIEHDMECAQKALVHFLLEQVAA